MKKIIENLGIVMFAIMFFYNTESVNNTQNIVLSNLMEMNTPYGGDGEFNCYCTLFCKCTASESGSQCAIFLVNGQYQNYNNNC